MDCSNITGWSVDDDNLAKTNQIHIYLTPNSTPTALPTFRAATCDASVNHGFEFAVPSKYRINAQKAYSVLIYAISIKSDGTVGSEANATLLRNQSLTCGSAAAVVSDNNSPRGNVDVWIAVTSPAGQSMMTTPGRPTRFTFT